MHWGAQAARRFRWATRPTVSLQLYGVSVFQFLPPLPLSGSPLFICSARNGSFTEQYHYGWAVPFLCAYLFWKRWNWHGEKMEVWRGLELGTGPNRPSTIFYLLFSICLLILLPTRILQEANPLWRFASYALAGEAIVITLALIYFAGRWRALRHFAFPVCFFLVAIPWPSPVEGAIINSLTRLNTAAVIEVMNLLGIPALAHGNVIEVRTRAGGCGWSL